MTQPFREWNVLPHGILTAVEDNILTVVGEIPMPVGNMKRRMTVVRLRDGRLVIFSAIALGPEEMRSLESFGKPAFLIVPNDHHRLDAKVWKDRYPAIAVITPAGARAKVEKIVPVDAIEAHFDDPDVTLVTVPGTHAHEVALEIKGENGTTLVLNDIVGNIRDASGFGGWMLRLMGFAGDTPQIPLPIRLVLVDNSALLAAQLERWADLPSLKRIIVSHGATIEDDPGGALRDLAAALR